MQILAKLFVRVFQIRHEDVSCFQQGVEGLVSLPRKSDFCRLLCDKSSGQLLYQLSFFRADLDVPVDPVVKASDASMSGGAICGSVRLMARGLGASRLAEAKQTSLCDDGVVLNCIN